MGKILIGRPINGISVNGLEYVLDGNGEPMRFDSEEAAKVFLRANGITAKAIEDMGIMFVNEDEPFDDCEEEDEDKEITVKPKYVPGKGVPVGVFYFKEIDEGKHLAALDRMEKATGLTRWYTEPWLENCVPVGRKYWLCAECDRRDFDAD